MARLIKANYSEQTIVKQKHFKYILNVYFNIIRCIFEKYKDRTSDRFFYMDMNSGPGIYPNLKKGEEIPGSPIIFQQCAKKHRIPYYSFFIDRDIETLGSLISNLKGKENINILLGKNQKEIFHCLENVKYLSDNLDAYGLIYSDCNGEISEMPFEVLSEISKDRIMNKIDILIYISASIIKRVRNSSMCKFNSNLLSLMSMIDKKYWLVRKPITHFQWTFLLGTNWDAFPSLKKLNFHPACSREGNEILRKLAFTNKELKCGLAECHCLRSER